MLPTAHTSSTCLAPHVSMPSSLGKRVAREKQPWTQQHALINCSCKPEVSTTCSYRVCVCAHGQVWICVRIRRCINSRMYSNFLVHVQVFEHSLAKQFANTARPFVQTLRICLHTHPAQHQKARQLHCRARPPTCVANRRESAAHHSLEGARRMCAHVGLWLDQQAWQICGVGRDVNVRIA